MLLCAWAHDPTLYSMLFTTSHPASDIPSASMSTLQYLLRAPINLRTPLQPRQRRESPPRPPDTAPDQDPGDDDPEAVHEDEVEPVVEGLRPRVADVEYVLVEEARGVVEDVAVELAEGDDELEGVAERVLGCDHVGCCEGEGAPKYLRGEVSMEGGRGCGCDEQR
jgi:hypothetical protein